MTLLVVAKICGATQVFTDLAVAGYAIARSVGRAGRADSSSRRGVFPSLLLTTLLLILLPILPSGGLNAPGA